MREFVGFRRARRARLATAATVAAVAIVLTTGSANAGTDPNTRLQVFVEVSGADSLDVVQGLELELFEQGSEVSPLDCTDSEAPAPVNNSTLLASRTYQCDDLDGTYTLGFDGQPPGLALSFVSCTDPGDLVVLDDPNAEFSINDNFPDVTCFVRFVQPTVIIDKVVVDETSPPGDFTIEVFDEGGLVTTGTDSSTDTCVDEQGNVLPFPADECLAIALAPGEYQLGEVPVPGYLPTAVGCTSLSPVRQAEVFPELIGRFTLTPDFGDASPIAYCRIVNEAFDGRIVVDKVVVNDDGGTATPDDFTAEVYDSGGGMLQTSSPCAADGSCIDTLLPIGQYRVGESGPDGYAATVACQVTSEPDTPSIDPTPPSIDVRRVANLEALPGNDALFELEPFGEVTCTITNDDEPQETTTTATTTTTVAPPPPTDPPPPPTIAAQLPETGSSSSTSISLAAIAAGLIALGSALVLARRRTS